MTHLSVEASCHRQDIAGVMRGSIASHNKSWTGHSDVSDPQLLCDITITAIIKIIEYPQTEVSSGEKRPLQSGYSILKKAYLKKKWSETLFLHFQVT